MQISHRIGLGILYIASSKAEAEDPAMTSASSSTSTYPAGGTWFDTLKKSFVHVPIDASNSNAVDTTAFLDASESLTTLFGSRSLIGLLDRSLT